MSKYTVKNLKHDLELMGKKRNPRSELTYHRMCMALSAFIRDNCGSKAREAYSNVIHGFGDEQNSHMRIAMQMHHELLGYALKR